MRSTGTARASPDSRPADCSAARSRWPAADRRDHMNMEAARIRESHGEDVGLHAIACSPRPANIAERSLPVPNPRRRKEKSENISKPMDCMGSPSVCARTRSARLVVSEARHSDVWCGKRMADRGGPLRSAAMAVRTAAHCGRSGKRHRKRGGRRSGRGKRPKSAVISSRNAAPGNNARQFDRKRCI